MKPQSTLNAYILQAVKENWGSPALSDFGGDTYTYADVAERIEKLHILFDHAGLKPGDKVALCGKNCACWAISALACLTYGAVAVPILHDFKADTIHHLVGHCEAKILFTDAAIWNMLDHDNMAHLTAVIRIADYSVLGTRNRRLGEVAQKLGRLFGEKYPGEFTPECVDYPDFKSDELALINYTSGSMGFSKGVMLSYGNLWSNIQYCIDGLTFLKPADGMVSMLPLAHMFGFSVEMLHPFVKGCHTHFMTRTPSPKILLGAFAEVQPKLIVAVPLIIEKIVRTRVFPAINKPMMKFLLHLPVVKDRIYAKIRAKLVDAFGGKVEEVIIGGAPLNKDVEQFLRRIKFPYSVGYGMTECAPLISYTPWDINKPGSCGRIVDRMEARIDSPDPVNTPGLLWVRGDNVMQGYLKNPEATEAALGADGWMNTGDIAQIDADGFLFIRGRDKNMILGPSGQNIYPEEIEQMFNNMPFVGESIAVSRDGKIIVLVHPDYEEANREGLDRAALEKQMKDNLKEVNANLPNFSQISDIEIREDEFEKTPKRSIKRYLYR